MEYPYADIWEENLVRKLIYNEEFIKKAIDEGVIRFITGPKRGEGTVCEIGDRWFYMMDNASEWEKPDEYLRHPTNDIVSDVLLRLMCFRSSLEVFGDEAFYYESVLMRLLPKEALAKKKNKPLPDKENEDYERGYRQALEDINKPMRVITPKYGPSKCPRCGTEYQELEECRDGDYKRAKSLQRCPYCGQKILWK